ncbi:uncharacterized protein LOC134188222 [Corticium candelabrum]|uniref:uncharacterized protein LOC134188222 n=1 Tax=Corticium candelabrum TaxID=121492 RepID=UPI002E27268E|nr:uncharacterized protein LOC134188222 [Corticium candelabrum]
MYREQSDVIRIFFSDQVRFEEFFYLRVFKFCLEKTSNTLVSVTEKKKARNGVHTVFAQLWSAPEFLGKLQETNGASHVVPSLLTRRKGIPEVQGYRRLLKNAPRFEAELELYSRLVMSLAMFFANSLNALALFI